MQVWMNIAGSNTEFVRTNPHGKWRDLNQQIAGHVNEVDMENISRVCAGKQIESDRTAMDHNICETSTIYVTTRVRGDA